jgi:hypothetical protein
VPYFKLCIA